MSLAPEVQQFLIDWLQDGSPRDAVEWFLDDDLVDKVALKKALLKIVKDHREEAYITSDPEEKTSLIDYANKAERAANTL